jgi:hypothetical protein
MEEQGMHTSRTCRNSGQDLWDLYSNRLKATFQCGKHKALPWTVPRQPCILSKVTRVTRDMTNGHGLHVWEVYHFPSHTYKRMESCHQQYRAGNISHARASHEHKVQMHVFLDLGYRLWFIHKRETSKEIYRIWAHKVRTMKMLKKSKYCDWYRKQMILCKGNRWNH